MPPLLWTVAFDSRDQGESYPAPGAGGTPRPHPQCRRRPLLYGTVGICPAFSCASRAALSPASCAASSLGLKVPAAGAVPAAGVEVAAGVVVVVVLVWALDPTIADPTSALSFMFIPVSLHP